MVSAGFGGFRLVSAGFGGFRWVSVGFGRFRWDSVGFGGFLQVSVGFGGFPPQELGLAVRLADTLLEEARRAHPAFDRDLSRAPSPLRRRLRVLSAGRAFLASPDLTLLVDLAAATDQALPDLLSLHTDDPREQAPLPGPLPPQDAAAIRAALRHTLLPCSSTNEAADRLGHQPSPVLLQSAHPCLLIEHVRTLFRPLISTSPSIQAICGWLDLHGLRPLARRVQQANLARRCVAHPDPRLAGDITAALYPPAVMQTTAARPPFWRLPSVGTWLGRHSRHAFHSRSSVASAPPLPPASPSLAAAPPSSVGESGPSPAAPCGAPSSTPATIGSPFVHCPSVGTWHGLSVRPPDPPPSCTARRRLSPAPHP